MTNPKSNAPRPYRMGARAEAAEATRLRILHAAFQLFSSSAYDDVSLESIAERAEVALKTVQRRFGSKDGVLLALSEIEHEVRDVPVGDIDEVVRVLSSRYEESMDILSSYIAVEPRVPAVKEMLVGARKGHFKWLSETLAPYLPDPKTPQHRRRVAQLFAATELYVWHSWRRHLGLGREVATETMREMLVAILGNPELSSTSTEPKQAPATALTSKGKKSGKSEL
jgi:AcrR family transcriptional regulator